MTQLRFEPRARTIYDRARANGHTKREAIRILKRHLSNVIYPGKPNWDLLATITLIVTRVLGHLITRETV